MASYDAVIIGSGHNGLICGSYLARAGMKVLVVERNDRVGGGLLTEEATVPGFRHNLHANFFMGPHMGTGPRFPDPKRRAGSMGWPGTGEGA